MPNVGGRGQTKGIQRKYGGIHLSGQGTTRRYEDSETEEEILDKVSNYNSSGGLLQSLDPRICYAGWRFGLVVTRWLDQRSCATSDPVSTRMGDRLWTGKPSRYVTSQLGRLSFLPSVGQ